MTTVQYVIRDLLARTSAELLISVLQETGNEDYAPWLDIHGTGGTIELLEDILLVRQTVRGQVEVAALLAALDQPQPEVYIGEPQEHMHLRTEPREQTLAGRFDDVPLADVVAEVQEAAHVAIRLDTVRLEEFGVGGDQP